MFIQADIIIIIPVYNEERVIVGVVNELAKSFNNIICINDGSSDNSVNEILKTKARLINHPINLGQGAALQTGVDFALQDESVEYFVTFDADGQHSVEDVKKMLKVIKEAGVDVVLGSRFLGEAKGVSFIKKIILKFAIIFSNRMSGIKLTDAHNGLRVFNRKFAENLNITMNDFAHASEIIEIITKGNFKYKEVPVTIKYTKYSKSKGQSVFNAINIGFDILVKRLHK